MLKINKEACEKCIASYERVTSKIKISHYGVIFDRGIYRWFAVIVCRGYCGTPVIRECDIDADDNEELYKAIFGSLPAPLSNFRKEIDKKFSSIVKKHCELSRKCPFYEVHFICGH